MTIECCSCGEDYAPAVQGPSECEPCLVKAEAATDRCRQCGYMFDPWSAEAVGPFCGAACESMDYAKLRAAAADARDAHADDMYQQWKDEGR